MPLLLALAALSFAPPQPVLFPRNVCSRHGAATCIDDLAAPAVELWDAYNAALVAHPLPTKAITAGVIIGAGDAAAQLFEHRGDNFDVARVLRWAVFGLVLQGPWNHFFYQLLDNALPPTPSPFTLTTLEKVGAPPHTPTPHPLPAIQRQAYPHLPHDTSFFRLRRPGRRCTRDSWWAPLRPRPVIVVNTHSRKWRGSLCGARRVHNKLRTRRTHQHSK